MKRRKLITAGAACSVLAGARAAAEPVKPERYAPNEGEVLEVDTQAGEITSAWQKAIA